MRGSGTIGRRLAARYSEGCRPPIPRGLGKVAGFTSESVAAFRRNGWPTCVGISGRLGSEYAWTVASANDMMHRLTDDLQGAQSLTVCPALPVQWRETLNKRVETKTAGSASAKLYGPNP